MSGSLSRYAPMMREADPMEAYRLKKRLFHELGIVVINPAEDLVQDGDYGNRELINSLGNRIYGKRKK